MDTVTPFPIAPSAPGAPNPPDDPPVVSRFPVDQRDLDAPHRRLLVPLADLIAVATEAAQGHRDPLTAERLDQAWMLVVACIVDTQGERDPSPVASGQKKPGTRLRRPSAPGKERAAISRRVRRMSIMMQHVLCTTAAVLYVFWIFGLHRL